MTATRAAYLLAEDPMSMLPTFVASSSVGILAAALAFGAALVLMPKKWTKQLLAKRWIRRLAESLGSVDLEEPEKKS